MEKQNLVRMIETAAHTTSDKNADEASQQLINASFLAENVNMKAVSNTLMTLSNEVCRDGIDLPELSEQIYKLAHKVNDDTVLYEDEEGFGDYNPRDLEELPAFANTQGKRVLDENIDMGLIYLHKVSSSDTKDADPVHDHDNDGYNVPDPRKLYVGVRKEELPTVVPLSEKRTDVPLVRRHASSEDDLFVEDEKTGEADTIRGFMSGYTSPKRRTYTAFEIGGIASFIIMLICTAGLFYLSKREPIAQAESSIAEIVPINETLVLSNTVDPFQERKEKLRKALLAWNAEK